MPELVAPKPILLPAVHPNVGIEKAYRRKLDELIDEMEADIARTILPEYRENEPEMSQDAIPARVLTAAMGKLRRKWLKRFDEAAPKLAAYFSVAASERATGAMRSILDKAGFSVKFTLTPEVRDIVAAQVSENVSLIKSIASEHFTQIEGHVMRSVTAGRDLGPLAEALHDQYGVTKRRAALIALNQNNQATAAITRARQEELGLYTARWVHSRGGKTPRPSHVAFAAGRNGGPFYDTRKGAFIEGEHIWPGQLINCFPSDTPVSLKTPPIALWRAPFKGPMVHLQIGTDLLKGTPNHPILTARGWVPMGEVHCGDHVVCVAPQCFGVVDDHEDNRKTTIGELFESCARAFGYVSRNGAGFNFYGDRPNGHVDEVIVGNPNLLFDRETSAAKNVSEFSLSGADEVMRLTPPGSFGDVAGSGGSSGGDVGASLTMGHLRHSDGVGVASASHLSSPNKHGADIAGGVSRNAESLGDSRSSHAVSVHGDDLISKPAPISASRRFDADGLELRAQLIGVTPDLDGRIFEFGSVFYEFRCVLDKRIMDFSGHVFTMETSTGHYSVGDAHAQAKNCRCVSRAVIPGFS